jgi:hypothetical protein
MRLVPGCLYQVLCGSLCLGPIRLGLLRMHINGRLKLFRIPDRQPAGYLHCRTMPFEFAVTPYSGWNKEWRWVDIQGNCFDWHTISFQKDGRLTAYRGYGDGRVSLLSFHKEHGPSLQAPPVLTCRGTSAIQRRHTRL